MKDANTRDRRRILLTLFAVLAVMTLIFYYSSQTGNRSGKNSAVLVSFALRFIKPDFASLSVEEQTRLWNSVSFAIRKLAHFTEYALLGFTLMLHLDAIHRIRKLRFEKGLAFLVGALYAVSDELHQGFVDGRAPSIRDVGIDSLGVLFGLGVVAAVLGRKNK